MTDLVKPDDTRDALRKLGGLLLGTAALMIFIRKTQGDPWGDFALFLVLAIPAALLYGGGVFTIKETGGPRPWQAVFSVFGLIFVPLALLQFVELIGGETSELNTFWIFGVTAALAGYAGLVAGIRFHLLAGSIALIVSWSALWDKILGEEGIAGHIGTYRGVLGILAIGLLVGAVYLWRENPGEDEHVASATDPGGDQGLWKASELFTGAGISAVLACSLGIAQLANVGEAFSPLAFNAPETSLFWDALLLIISLGLIGVGSTVGVRGPVYIGGIGLFLFLLLAGLDLDGDPPDPSNFGVWPIVLLVLGGLGLALSSVGEASQGDKPKQLVDKIKGS
jgi:hypothetical protein